MLASSPDLYLSIVNVNLYEVGEFITEKTLVDNIYDSGTDGIKILKLLIVIPVLIKKSL